MHNVFHVSWFKPYVGPPLTKLSDEQQPKVLDEAEVVEPDQILLHRWKHGSGRRQRQYLTKFRDRGTHEAVWLDGDFFIEYPQLLADYLDAMQLSPIKAEGNVTCTTSRRTVTPSRRCRMHNPQSSRRKSPQFTPCSKKGDS